MSAFCFLSIGLLARDLTTEYMSSVQALSTYLENNYAVLHSEFTFLKTDLYHGYRSHTKIVMFKMSSKPIFLFRRINNKIRF